MSDNAIDQADAIKPRFEMEDVERDAAAHWLDEALKAIADIERAYNTTLPDEMKLLVSYAPKGAFFDDWRLLSARAILAADEELQADFKAAGLIPLFDVFDGDYIVYSTSERRWSMYSAVDDVAFNEVDDLRTLLVSE
ncbi:MAG: SMI1/KNR4 family protein [Eggerthellaceae bacterium]|nr:SMI1/KNR4 family protein [Eggerthellaceae bacterium]